MNRPYVDYKNLMLGKRVNTDSKYGYQCVDLFKDYCAKVLGIVFKKTGNAKQVWTNTYKIFDKTWERIQGMHNLMQGDIIVSTNGRYGHIGIVDHVMDGRPFILEQNGSGKNSGSGTGANAIRVQGYDPEFFAGVWRCMKIFTNLQLERKYIDQKIKERSDAVTVTQSYRDSIRYMV